MTAIVPAQLQKARALAHSVIQWPARVANSFAPHEPDHCHLALRWDDERRTLCSREFDDGLSLDLRMPDLHMQFAEHGKLVPHVMNIEDHTPAEVEAWLLVELLHRNIGYDRFSKDLPYVVPGLLTGDSADYSPAACMPALVALTDWLHQGAAILGQLAPADAVLHCWPETFQIGRLVPLNSKGSKARPPLRVGVSAGDASCPEPHFFVTPDGPDRPTAPHPGAVLTMRRIAAERISRDGVAEFLKHAIAANGNGSPL